MEQIKLASGRRAFRKDGLLYQELDLGAEPVQRALAREKWQQYIGAPADTDLPPAKPVKLISRPKPMCVENEGSILFVPAGDFIAQDMDGRCSVVPAERVRDYTALAVASDAGREEAEAAARDTLKRISTMRTAARARSDQEAPSSISISEDKEGRGLLVSTLPDGRERIWKTFGWRSAAETFLSDPANRQTLERQHSEACRSLEGIQNVAHAYRMDRKMGSVR